MTVCGRICAGLGVLGSARDGLTGHRRGHSVGDVVFSRASSGRRRGFAARMRRLVSALVVAAVATIVALHLAVLWDRLSQGRLTDPEIALRWLGGAVLTVALLALRRRGISLLWGRRALVFWLLVLLLHAGVVAPDDPAVHATPVRLLFVVPASVAPLWVLLVLLATPLVRRAPRTLVSSPRRGSADVDPALRRGFLLTLSPRAPPA